jgi:glycosyltransferase involved in cell wall biosynthesis
MLCQQNWDIGLAFNAKNLAKEFAKQNQVLFVNLPLDLNTVLKSAGDPAVKQRVRVWRGQAESLVQAAPNLWVLTPPVLSLSINWLTSNKLFRKLNRWNSQLLAASIRKAVEAIGFGSYHFFQDGIIPQGLEMRDLLAPTTFTYYVRDYVLGQPYFRRHGPWVEAELCRQADVVVANSAYLGDYAREHNPHSYDIGQGCVLAQYDATVEHTVPTDLTAVPRPTIGYTGFLTEMRLDIDLLLTIARERPHWNLVLIGPEDEAFQRSALHGLPNVFFLGSKRPDQLAAYLQHFDVCINPQLANELTQGNYPLKIDEYLAMGRPVVATHTRAMDLFAPYTYLAHSTADWLRLLEQALAEAGPRPAAEGIAFAQSHTWAASAQAMYQALAATQLQAV